MISPCTPQLLIFIHEPINLRRTLWSFTYMANVTNLCHFILETILQPVKPPGGENLDCVWISVVLAFLPHVIPKYKNQMLPLLENDGLTWEETDLSSPGECYGQRLKIHVPFTFLSTWLRQPTLFLFYSTLLAVQLPRGSREKDAVVFVLFWVGEEVSVLVKHFPRELCFPEVYYQLPPKHHVVQVTHVFFLPVGIDLFASILTRSTCKASLTLLNKGYQREL